MKSCNFDFCLKAKVFVNFCYFLQWIHRCFLLRAWQPLPSFSNKPLNNSNENEIIDRLVQSWRRAMSLNKTDKMLIKMTAGTASPQNMSSSCN